MSKIRIWKLGVIDGPNSILPTRQAIERLRDIVAEIPEEGIHNIIWGPELNVIELGNDTEIENYVVETVTTHGVDAELLTIELRKV